MFDKQRNDGNSRLAWVSRIPTRNQRSGTIKSFEEKEGVFAELDHTVSWESGSLYNNLMQLTPDDTIKPDDWKASADQDVIIPVLLITLSALVSAIKLRINLYAATARYYAPDSGGTCNSVTADSRYAEYTLRWIDAVHDLKLLVQEADPTLASEEQLSSLKLGQRILGFWQRILCLRASGDLAGWKNASFPSWLKADEDAIYSVMPLYQIVRDATKNDPLPPLQPQTFSIKDWMPISGAAALEALIYRRIQGCARRVNLVYAKQGQDRVFIVTNDQDKLHWLWDHEWAKTFWDGMTAVITTGTFSSPGGRLTRREALVGRRCSQKPNSRKLRVIGGFITLGMLSMSGSAGPRTSLIRLT
jgi:hypothetical protein